MMRDSAGVAAIEFAMIVPVLSLMLIGMVDYGLYITKKMQIQELSRRAVEYVVQGGQESDVQANVIAHSSLFTASPPVTYTPEIICECSGGAVAACSGNCAGNDYLRSFFAVTIQGTYEPLLTYPGIPDNITLTGYSRLQYAR